MTVDREMEGKRKNQRWVHSSGLSDFSALMLSPSLSAVIYFPVSFLLFLVGWYVSEFLGDSKLAALMNLNVYFLHLPGIGLTTSSRIYLLMLLIKNF